MNFKIVKNAKISIKLTIVYAFMFCVVLLLLNASILYGVKYHLYRQADKEIEDIQTIVLNKVTLQNEKIDLSDSELFLEIPFKENISIRIIQQDGKVLNSTKKFPYDVEEFQLNAKSSQNKEKHIEDKEKHLVYKNVRFESKAYGIVFFQIVKDMGNEYDFMKILFAVMAIADFIGIIVSIILGYMVSKRMLKPIDNIIETAENISINNLKERIDIKGPNDELKRLASTFNNMIDRLQASFNRQVQFVSDASHELRTPITVIQGYANLLDRWGKDDRKALEKSIYAIKLEASNMANLVEKLLFLARGDSGTQLIEKKEFLLNELIDEVVKETEMIEEGHLISNKKNEFVRIVADYNMIKQMLRVFIDNSLKFTPKNGNIDISSEVKGTMVEITVSDTGIGIPEDEVENIFDRFYIVDKSRSKEKGGTGLGLSIAKWIIDMHNGTINLESEEGKGTKIIVGLNIKNNNLK
ncbi:sensor histidine kinase [Clostridium saccharobutylicum]|uniref:histidine kinase n=1 Tax=Clostridium saccharobutylicum DSM 13864 TaxID=1345695 RepID=U5MTI7_CLOSA|nr:HAMP domain-containing sensor histidine kinase [Clostridium saccharobutylicum]AGX43858.1 signal transduction histidine-protein kinase ArlS [Clostridium saccharobutylicum DSM 13864]MBA2905170.1 heavy metal sensor kinase [Clostridium saccharobutylicum]MBA8789743.1 heavy metal sensor kinase [Clostridium saccharobutylicum]MBA8896439.1 heavy metal sensor kinase [Clostridium saccharobutylicum]MBA8983227.1 heavy metal sensor kinase [Clostridium saccharobutylicum]